MAFDFDINKYRQQYLKDQGIQQEICETGYAVLPFLNEGDVKFLKSMADELIAKLPDGLPDMFWPSGRSDDPMIRNFAKEAIDAVVPNQITEFFYQEKIELIGGTYLLKPPSENSALNPHQDSSHVDERNFFSVYAWIPLQDVDVDNGAMHVLPGSHKFGNFQRSLNVPWQFRGKEEILREYMIPVPMKAGEVLFFDAALIHHSPPNISEKIRYAINYYIHPCDCPFSHYYIDEQTPDGQVEWFSVRPEFYYNEDFESRPSSKYPSLGLVPYPDMDCTEDGIRKMCEDVGAVSIC